MWIRIILGAVLVCLLILHFLKLRQRYLKYPQGPSFLKIAVTFIQSGFRIRPDIFAEWAKDHGSIYTIWGGPMPLVILVGYQAVKEGLIKNSEAFSGRPVTPFYKVVANEKGIVFSNGHTWKQQRKFGISSLRKLGMGKKGVEHQVEDEALQLVETFANAKGQPIDPSLPIINSVCNVICALVFGHRYNVNDEEFLVVLEALEDSMKFGGTFFHILYEMVPWLMKYIKWPYKKVFSSVDTVLSHARKEIEAHRERQAAHDPQDFIDYYLLQMEKRKNDPTSTYDEANLCQCISDFFIAGTETTSSSLQWAVLLMVAYPDIQEKVQKEIDEAIGSSTSISYQDRKKVPYTTATICETQRFKCVLLSGNPRQCLEDVTIEGTLIPKGSIIVPDVHSILNDPKLWETPQKFNPNHFLDKDGKFVDREELLLFGAGARVCVGKEMARLELFIFFTNLMRAFTFKMPEGVKDVSLDPIEGLTFSPKPYKLCAIPRLSES